MSAHHNNNPYPIGNHMQLAANQSKNSMGGHEHQNKNPTHLLSSVLLHTFSGT
ncbi:hypothetical protein HanRHA438_Chr17g0814841 [Helianthus annuus]|nr:hypothetical protein HanIR_Chr17g0872981 [Helianthus annuus]KAJ0826488.1 hypothetical protein HanRHA438_Chr17g0814841 [Helianthus annuus]